MGLRLGFRGFGFRVSGSLNEGWWVGPQYSTAPLLKQTRDPTSLENYPYTGAHDVELGGMNWSTK